MKNLQETMKQLQKASESLSKLGFDPDHPWKALSQMGQVLDTNFWENIATLNKQAAQKTAAAATPTVPPVKKGKKKTKEKPMRFVQVDDSHFSPVSDIFQSEEMVIVSCELPGFDRDSLEITLFDQRWLEVKGIIKESEHKGLRTQGERSYGPFYRKLALPVSVSSKGMRAQYQDGVLEIYLMRGRAANERKTTFKASL
ncbi:Hsp20/alpha crystallin family protein [Brevibacillus sp. M2.1A]|uniref:Hsp20/alpha crystallin family protein n=1 Tax=Brevibacillus TaxID=55080 RepID=UPI00156B0F07|nr:MULTISPECIES: Hsp20/alpha crystallin family protein [Brevibacillus]MBY0088630.1 Hsp20/alpha crystallin family protein [Brevibacillus brevis]MCC8437142.1 Hsp20/alpha crystallin family protein [Brevibacillus sp. M2.1A]UKK99293.1 Hsp20/alpha crystallin family protein [Brevibacillus brevis]